MSSGVDVVGTRVAKEFEQVLYTGIVTEYLHPISSDDDPLWQIEYDDGDQQQLDISELNARISLFKNMEKKLPILEVPPSSVHP